MIGNYAWLLIVAYVTLFNHVKSFQSPRILRSQSTRLPSISNDDYSSQETVKAMQAARDCAANGLSPGAGLATAEEQAEAAYADMINTTIDQKGISLSENELLDLNRGGRMWEEGAITSKNKFGLLSDLSNLWKALAGGAHIEKNEFGET